MKWLGKKLPNLEWSGVLFYKHISGSIEQENLKIACIDFYLMDIGTSGYTDFDQNDNHYIDYLMNHSELMEENIKKGKLHSHELGCAA